MTKPASSCGKRSLCVRTSPTAIVSGPCASHSFSCCPETVLSQGRLDDWYRQRAHSSPGKRNFLERLSADGPYSVSPTKPRRTCRIFCQWRVKHIAESCWEESSLSLILQTTL